MTKQTKSVKLVNRKVEQDVGTLPRSRVERGERLKAIREASHLTAAEFARRCGVTEPTQFNYERGLRVPDADYFHALWLDQRVNLTELITGAQPVTIDFKDPQIRSVLESFQVLPERLKRGVDDLLLAASLAARDREADLKAARRAAAEKLPRAGADAA